MAPTITVVPEPVAVLGAGAARPLTPVTTAAGTVHDARHYTGQLPDLVAATSVDGVWLYARQGGPDAFWSVTHTPTGQERVAYVSLDDARASTADGALLSLQREAFALAWSPTSADRERGQRLIAVHMRLAGQDEADHRCECGGLLVQATRDGKLAHVDACGECWTLGAAGVRVPCPAGGVHLVCGDPCPVLCGHNTESGCGTLAVPNDGGGCERGGAVDCCLVCCAER